MLIWTRSPTTLQLQQNGLEDLRTKARKLSVHLKPIYNPDYGNGESTDI